MFLTGVGFGATDFSLNQSGARSGAGRAVRLTLLNAAFGTGAVLGPAIVGWLGLRALTVGFALAACWAWAMAAGVLGITTAPPARGGSGAGAATGRTLRRTTQPVTRTEARRVPGVQTATRTGRGGAARAAIPGRGPGRARLPAVCRVRGQRRGVDSCAPCGARLSVAPGDGGDIGVLGGDGRRPLVTVPLSRAVAASRIVLAACPLLTLALALTAVRTIAPACYVAAGFIAAPIWPIGLDWVVAKFPGYRSATSWALTAAFAGGIAGPAIVAGVVSIAGLHAVPAVLAAFAGATTLAFLAIWRERARKGKLA